MNSTPQPRQRPLVPLRHTTFVQTSSDTDPGIHRACSLAVR
jgi:hypothetical protein